MRDWETEIYIYKCRKELKKYKSKCKKARTEFFRAYYLRKSIYIARGNKKNNRYYT